VITHRIATIIATTIATTIAAREAHSIAAMIATMIAVIAIFIARFPAVLSARAAPPAIMIPMPKLAASCKSLFALWCLCQPV